MNRQYNKRTNRWVAIHRKLPKNYQYADDLIKRVFQHRLGHQGSLSQSVQFSQQDPRRIAPNLAPLKPAPTKEIFQSTVSRFKNEDIKTNANDNY